MTVLAPLISSLETLDKTVVVKITDTETLMMQLEPIDRAIICEYTNTANDVIMTKLNATHTFDDILFFCRKGSIRRLEGDEITVISTESLDPVLMDVINGLINTPRFVTVERLATHLRKLDNPTVWSFGGITVTLIAESDGIRIETDNPDYEPERDMVYDSEEIEVFTNAVAQCTITGKDENGKYISSSDEVFAKVTAVLQQIGG